MRGLKTLDYLDIQELAKICRQKGIKNHTEYLKRYKEIPGATSNIARIYGDKYPGWNRFIRIECEGEDPEFLRKIGIFHTKI
jgi:hypothetical protein